MHNNQLDLVSSIVCVLIMIRLNPIIKNYKYISNQMLIIFYFIL